MNPELLVKAENLWKRAGEVDNFNTVWNYYPPTELQAVYDTGLALIEQLPENPEPRTIDELHEAELRQKLWVMTNIYDHALTGDPVTFEESVRRADLQPDEIDQESLRSWLLGNRPAAREALDTMHYLTRNDEKRRDPLMDIPSVEQRFVEYATTHVRHFHQKLIDLTSELSNVGEHLRNLAAEPTKRNRSYFSLHTKKMAYAINKVCSESETGEPLLNCYQMIRLNGHERNGHALQLILSTQAGIPFFMEDSGPSTAASEEGLALHYEKVIFEDVNNSPETQKDLGIVGIFDNVYRFHQAKQITSRYTSALTNYSIALLADRSLGNPTDEDVILQKMEIFADVALDAKQIYNYIGKQRYKYLPGGFYDPDEINEMIYGSQAVQRALAVFEANGYDYTNRDDRSLIDQTLLTGYYTPTGLVQKVKLIASPKPTPLPTDDALSFHPAQ